MSAVSRTKLVSEHSTFLEQYGTTPTQDQYTFYARCPVRILKRTLEKEREEFLKRLETDPANITVLEEEIAFHKYAIKGLEEELECRKQRYATKMGWNLV
jgi:hypothetical protein